jgi:hypothetical protein
MVAKVIKRLLGSLRHWIGLMVRRCQAMRLAAALYAAVTGHGEPLQVAGLLETGVQPAGEPWLHD